MFLRKKDKMKLVVNYLKEVEELFEEGKIDFVDYFKLYSLNEDISALDWCIAHRPVMFHGIIGKASMFGEKNFNNAHEILNNLDEDTMDPSSMELEDGTPLTFDIEERKEEKNSLKNNGKQPKEDTSSKDNQNPNTPQKIQN